MANRQNKAAMIGYIIVSLIAIIILLVLFMRCKGKDGYCVCYQDGECKCSNAQERKRLYAKGLLTEYTPQKFVANDPMPPATRFHTYAGYKPRRC